MIDDVSEGHGGDTCSTPFWYAYSGAWGWGLAGLELGRSLLCHPVSWTQHRRLEWGCKPHCCCCLHLWDPCTGHTAME